MTYLEQAIERAVKGGFGLEFISFHPKTNQITLREREFDGYIDWKYKPAELLMLPRFWQALGKADGWAETEDEIDQYQFSHDGLRTWMWHWHSFIDALIAGTSPEDFFKSI